jgi:cytochrome c
MNRCLPLKSLIFIVFTLSLGLLTSCSHHNNGKPRILVFSKTAGFHHESIADGNIAIQKLGAANNFDVDTTTDAGFFNDDTLKKYATVVFLSTTGDIFNSRQRVALERYVQAGGGFVGIHAAADANYDWHWYGRLVGGYFLDHPGIHDSFPNVQQGVINVVDTGNASTQFLPRPWKRTDEFYSYKELNKDVHILLNIDETSYKGGHKMGDHPMAWEHEYDGGRAFYTELGHTKESYTEENYLKHLLAGIQYAIGEDYVEYAKAKSPYPPEDERFVKTQLFTGQLYEPTEMTILPNFDILILERRGGIKLYKHDTKQVKQVGLFDVYCKTLHTPGVNAEEGMLGLAKDPEFTANHFVYIYYSPADSSVNRLSRFTFVNDTLDKATEKTILEVKSQREICCHTGGSIAFGPDKLLYFSAGDNSTPFDEKGAKYVNSGFAPLNDVPGHQQFDARRSAGNSNDLRGKIMRLKINSDATYDIPEGNLFPRGTPKTRPEIYVMGDRNPYRISVDQKNSYLYWGEVGPDANNDSFDTRGPRGYDEMNQARKAGFFGWPLFVGNNYAYHEYDYATGKNGAAFDPAHPVNNSRNNTGLVDLPPAQPAFIWYPYGPSPDFPEVGTGGRNAMAGPVYYTDLFPDSTRYPDYYNGKLIVYEWMRGWMKAVTMQPNGDFDKFEPFAPGVKMNSDIDMEVGPDGRLYLLEYGTGWFTQNADAGLARIDYIKGNLPPVVSSVNVDKTSGLLPFAVKASTTARDPENGKLSYAWDLGNGTTKETTEPNLDYTYTTAGDYTITVKVKDDQGDSVKSAGTSVYAGNEEPTVGIRLQSSNRSFYLPGKPVGYTVDVKDNDTAKIDPANLYVSVDYIKGYDKSAIPMGHQQGQAAVSGKQLTQTLDCKSCHKEADKSIGPAFILVAQKYQKDPKAATYLANKITNGGSGVWGETKMSAHPSIPQSDLNQIVGYILALGNTAAVKKSLPQSGSIVAPSDVAPGSAMVITASYTDKGGNNIKALTGKTTLSLGSNTLLFHGREKTKGFNPFKYNGSNLLLFPAGEGWFATNAVDLTGVGSVSLTCGWQAPPKNPLSFEAHLDSPDGKTIGKGTITPASGKKGAIAMAVATLPISDITDGTEHAIYIVYKGVEAISGGIMSITFNAK